MKKNTEVKVIDATGKKKRTVRKSSDGSRIDRNAAKKAAKVSPELNGRTMQLVQQIPVTAYKWFGNKRRRWLKKLMGEASRLGHLIGLDEVQIKKSIRYVQMLVDAGGRLGFYRDRVERDIAGCFFLAACNRKGIKV